MKKTNNAEIISVENIVKMFEQELAKKNFGSWKVSIEYVPGPEVKAAGIGVGTDIVGLTEPIESLGKPDSVRFFIKGFIKAAKDFFSQHPILTIISGGKKRCLKNMVQAAVRHEYRHTRQFEFFRKEGIDVVQALFDEACSVYGTGKMEVDAIIYQSLGFSFPMRRWFKYKN